MNAVEAGIHICTADFLSAVRPLLAERDLSSLTTHLRRRYSLRQLIALLDCQEADVRKVAALSLGLVGDRDSLPALARALKDPDEMTHQMAEHAIWSIWFRLGSPEANHELARAALAIERREFDAASRHLTAALATDPEFAEAYNQRAIVQYLQEAYSESLADCKRAVQRMPCHFGAWAGMGHCYAHLGRMDDAVKCYETALAINPRLDAVRQAIAEMRCGTVRPGSEL